ncbi:MAG: hypothetical protein PVG07_02990 [Acidobacteriota bacterium]|jgi:hypothetical protein
MPASHPPIDDERIRRALELLAEAARERLRLHPQGHMVSGSREGLELPLALPLSADRDSDRAAVERAARELQEAIGAGIDGLLHHRSAFRPGRVYCLRCEGAECEHAALPSPRATFAGYGPSGVPRFVDFPQWLVERHDPRAGDLYQRTSQVVAVPVPGEELLSQLLAVYRDRIAGYRLHGQVSAGFYRVSDRRGHEVPIAATFQVVSSRPGGNRRRYSLNVLALGPDGEPPEHLFDRLGESPWGPEVRWAASVLDSIERSVAKRGRQRKKKGGGAKKEVEDKAERRIEGLLKGLARRLEKGKRARERRTRHASKRHDQGDRPTRMALTDLARAKDEDVLLDARHRTFVVLGDRGRAHVFNRQGKLVTSIRYSSEAIERRRDRGRWRPLPRDEIQALRAMVEGEQSAGER